MGRKKKNRKTGSVKKRGFSILKNRKTSGKRKPRRKKSRLALWKARRRTAFLQRKARKERIRRRKRLLAAKRLAAVRARRRTAGRRRVRWTYFDRNMVLFLSNRRIKGFTAFMKFMTRVGDGVVWFVLCVVFLAIDLQVGLALAFSSIIQIILQQIIKRLFSRERPYQKYDEISHAMRPPDRFSFPSGHTAGAFAIAFVFWSFPPFRILFYPMLAVSSLIAFSRMYLGLHFPTDIVAGIILGAVSAILGTNLTQLIHF